MQKLHAGNYLSKRIGFEKNQSAVVESTVFENHSISPILREKLKTFIFEFTAKNDSSFTLVKTDFIVFARNEEKIVKRRHFWVIFNHCGLSLVNIKQTSSSYWSAIQNGSACNLIRNETSVHRVRLYLLYLTDYSLAHWCKISIFV